MASIGPSPGSVEGTDLTPSSDGQPMRIVGVGASAGGLESLRSLFDALPSDLGLTYVVLQHLAPTHRSLLTEILAKHCPLPVREVHDGDHPEPDTVLVTPPNSHIEFDGERLRLTVPEPQSLPRPSINLFLSSLATQLGPRAAGVILSGTGSDGALGLRQIQLAGGLVLVQPPESARYSGMPEAAIRTVGGQSLVLPQDVGAALRHWATHLAEAPTDATPSAGPSTGSDPAGAQPTPGVDPEDPLLPLPPITPEELEELTRRVRQHCGINLADYKEGTLLRRLARRCTACDTKSVSHYLQLAKSRPDELHILAAEMLISVTTFWRDPPPSSCCASVWATSSRPRSPAICCVCGWPAAPPARRPTRWR